MRWAERYVNEQHFYCVEILRFCFASWFISIIPRTLVLCKTTSVKQIRRKKNRESNFYRKACWWAPQDRKKAESLLPVQLKQPIDPENKAKINSRVGSTSTASLEVALRHWRNMLIMKTKFISSRALTESNGTLEASRDKTNCVIARSNEAIINFQHVFEYFHWEWFLHRRRS